MAILETHLADLRNVPPGAKVVLVMRGGGNDELAPSVELLEEFKNAASALVATGLDETTAHNKAWEDREYEKRFRRELESRPAAVRRMRGLAREAIAGDIVLVCYEAPPKKCHRHILRGIIQNMIDEMIQEEDEAHQQEIEEMKAEAEYMERMQAEEVWRRQREGEERQEHEHSEPPPECYE